MCLQTLKSIVRTQETIIKTQDSESPPVVLKDSTAENVTMLQCHNVTMLQCYNVTMLQDFFSRIEVILEKGF